MVKGITARIKRFFFNYSHSSAKQCCKMLGLDHKKYGSFCRKIKSQTKKLLEGNVYGRVQKLHPVKHREEMRLELPKAVVDGVEFEALKRQPGRGDPKPFDEWYVIPNRNRMMLLRNEHLTIRVFPKSGTCRILPSKPMPYDWVKIAVQNAFFKAGVDLRIAEKLSENLETRSRHRIFKVGLVTPFKIDHYKQSLGLTILADGSHPYHIETLEDFPPWVKPLISSMDALRRELPKELKEVTRSFERSMQEHLDIIKFFREESIKRSEEDRKRTQEIKKLVNKLLTKRKRKRKNNARPSC